VDRGENGLGRLPLDPSMVGYTSEPVERSWTALDVILYALGVGAGSADPFGSELEFTTECSQGVVQQVLPTFGVVLGTSRPVVGGFRGVDLARITHRSHSMTSHRPLPINGRVVCTSTIAAVYDTGEDGIMLVRTTVVDADTGEPVSTNEQTLHAKGAGGFRGHAPPDKERVARDRKPDHVLTYKTRPDQALLYRLTGDLNPLHCDPSFATRAGFERPILHGLCTFGIAGRLLLHALCQSDPTRFGTIRARFTRPVFPGDELKVLAWTSDPSGVGDAEFVVEDQRGRVVLDDGRFEQSRSRSRSQGGTYG
jgi:acyl dehydratase